MQRPPSSSPACAVPGSASSSLPVVRPMIVYDREGELFLRRRNWLGRTSWQKYYCVLCRLRKCLLLFEQYYLYERHLVELNAYESEYASWSISLPLQHASLYVASAYFSRPCVMELSTPDGCVFLSVKAEGRVPAAVSESNLRDWITSFGRAGVRLKSDEKPILMWRAPDAAGKDSFCFTRASSTMPAHDATKASSWESLSSSLTWSAAALMQRAAAMASPAGGGSAPLFSPHSAAVSSEMVQQLLGSEFSSDHSYAKHGYLQKLGRSLFARMKSDKSASTNPSSPFYDPTLAASESRAATSQSSSSNSWLTRFYRTAETASGRACLVCFHDREQTAPSGKTKHVLQLFQARVFDLQEIRRKVERECRDKMEAEERERWRRKAHTKRWGTQEDIFAHEKGSQRKARLAAFAADVQAAFVTHRLFPENLPAWSPKGECDFALYVRAPSPQYLFFRAPTPREKSKWVQCLRNLAGDVMTRERMQEKMTRALEALESARTEQESGGALATTTSATRQLLDTALPPSLSDEFEVHILRRDFYSILGVAPDASTAALTASYRALQAELRARMIPLSPLHDIVPNVNEEAVAEREEAEAEDAEAEAEAEEAAEVVEASKSSKRRASNFKAASASPAPSKSQSQSQKKQAQSQSKKKKKKHQSKDSKPTFAEDADDQSDAAVVAAAAAAASSKSSSHARMFSFDLNPVTGSPKKFVAGAKASAAATVVGASSALPAGLAPISAGPAAAAVPPRKRTLTPSEIQARLRYKLTELREIWRLLKDPVRRAQYDERREALKLGELGVASAEGADGNSNSSAAQGQHLLDDDDEFYLPRSLAGKPPAAGGADASAPINLDSVLARATACAQAQVFKPKPVPAAVLLAQASIKHHAAPGADEEKYPSPMHGRTLSDASAGVDESSRFASPLAQPVVSSAEDNGSDLMPPPMPGDIRTIEWPVNWGRHAANANSNKQDPALNRALSTPAASDARVRLELMYKSSWLGRTKLSAVLAASTPDNGFFEFTIPLDTPPSKHYFVRLTLLPPSSGSSSPPLVTDTATFEVVPLTISRRQSIATAATSVASTRRGSGADEKQHEPQRMSATPQPVKIAREPQYLSTPRV